MKRLMTILAAVCLVATANAQELTNFAFGRKQIVSPEQQNDSVTFRLMAPYATDVKMYGSWMPGYGDRINLTRNAEYVWEVKIPGRAEPVDTVSPAAVLVDYAHNGTALEQILKENKRMGRLHKEI